MVRSRGLFQEQPEARRGFTPGSTCPVPGEWSTGNEYKGRLLEQVKEGGSVLMERRVESDHIWGIQMTEPPDRSDMVMREWEESQVDLRFRV